jgi:hypothetical protein
VGEEVFCPSALFVVNALALACIFVGVGVEGTQLRRIRHAHEPGRLILEVAFRGRGRMSLFYFNAVRYSPDI